MQARVQRASLAQQAADALRQQIYRHELLPGQRLDETVLAEALGISRTPLREALKVLSTEGLVDLQTHKGCYVTELTLADLEEIFPIMGLLEGLVASEAAAKATPAQLKKLDELHEKLERHATNGHIDRYYETNYVFHETLQQVAGNRWLQGVIDDLRKLLKLSRHRSLKLEGRLEASLAEHRALMKALHAGKTEQAEKVMRQHLLAQLVALREIAQSAEEVVDG